MADPASLPPLPKNHLDHPENWATGTEPATEKQKGFIKVLEGQHPDAVPEGGIDVAEIGKSEASAVIDKLKNGKKVTSAGGVVTEKTQQSNDPNASAEEKETENPETSDEAASQTPDKPTQAKPTTPHKTSTSATAEKRKSPPSASARADKAAPESRGADVEMDREDEGAVAEDDDDDQPVKNKSKTDGDHNEKGEEEEHAVEDGTRAAKRSVADAAADASPVPEDNVVTPADGDDGASNTVVNGGKGETIPGDGKHLDHPENWATGDEPATEKQKGFLAVLEKKAGEPVENMEGLGKSEASAKIDELK